jgi:hypothetical protein
MSEPIINGVTFDEYASACARLSQGVPLEKITAVLGLEIPVWEDTISQWNNKFGELCAQDMAIVTRYSDLFANPIGGRFANAASDTTSIDDLLKLVPDLNTYTKIMWDQSVASQHGVDPVSVFAKYGLNLGEYGALTVYYGNVRNEVIKGPVQCAEWFEYDDTWKKHFEEIYAKEGVDLGEDIEF